MRHALKAFSAVVILSLAACVTPPQKRDVFSELNIQNKQIELKTYPRTKIALLHSDNTKATIQYLKKFTKSGISLFRHNYFPSAKFDVDRTYAEFDKLLTRHFMSVKRIADLRDAEAADADLVAVLDTSAEIAPPPAKKITTFQAKMIFLTPDKKQVDLFTADIEEMVPKRRNDTKIPAAAAKAAAKFEQNIAGSRRLALFTGQGAGAQPLAAAPIERTYNSSVDAPAYKLPVKPDNFALIIGIEKYANIPKADFAERDAASVRAHLIALGYPRKNIVHLDGQRAGKAGIEKYLSEWLPRNVKPSSKVFVYFSGHGSPDVKSGEAYLMPWDADAKFLESTGYPLRRLYGKLNRLKARQVLVVMDACFSGAGGRSVIAKGLRPLVTKIDTADASVEKLIVFSASGGDEVTGPALEEGHGLFTYHFLKGLQDSKGASSAQELYDYLLPQVQEGARRDNRDQTPRLAPDTAAGRLSVPLY